MKSNILTLEGIITEYLSQLRNSWLAKPEFVSSIINSKCTAEKILNNVFYSDECMVAFGVIQSEIFFDKAKTYFDSSIQ